MESIEEKSLEDKLKVFIEWKKLYSRALIDHLNPTGDVLEIGFGFGFAAERIEELHPKSHTIIESDPVTAINAKKWAEQHPGSRIIEGDWKETLKDLGQFNAIFYNGDLMAKDEITIMNFLFPEESIRQSKESKKLRDLLEEQISQAKKQFSDQDIEDFYQKTGRFFREELPFFFKQLKENGNISNAQYENALKKYPLSGENEPQELPVQKENLILLIEDCLKNHMAPGCRFSSFLSSQTSKYEDATFFDAIITNPHLHYKEVSAPIQVSDKTREGLLPLVEKIGP